MHTKSEDAGWVAALLIFLIIAAMMYSKTTRFADAEDTAAIETTGSITQ